MIYQIYGVKLIGDHKERRHYGGCDTEAEASDALDLVLLQCDYAYAKHPGGATVMYRETTEHRYPGAPLQAAHVHRQFPGISS